MEQQQLIAELAERSESRMQFERLLVFCLYPDARPYTRSHYYKLRAELHSLGIALPEVECRTAPARAA